MFKYSGQHYLIQQLRVNLITLLKRFHLTRFLPPAFQRLFQSGQAQTSPLVKETVMFCKQETPETSLILPCRSPWDGSFWKEPVWLAMTEHLLVTQGKGLNIYRYTDKQNSNNKNHTCFEELKNKNEVVLMQQMELPGIKKHFLLSQFHWKGRARENTKPYILYSDKCRFV